MVVVVETMQRDFHPRQPAVRPSAPAEAKPRPRSKSPSLRAPKPETRTPTPSGSGRGSTVPANSVRSLTPVIPSSAPGMPRRLSMTGITRPAEERESRPTSSACRSRSQSERTLQSQKLHAQRVRSGVASPVCEKRQIKPQTQNFQATAKADKKTQEQAARAWARNKERLEVAQQRLSQQQYPVQYAPGPTTKVDTQSVSTVSVEDDEVEKCGRSSACPTMVYSPVFDSVHKEIVFPDLGIDSIPDRETVIRMNPEVHPRCLIASLYADVSMVIPITQPRSPVPALQFEDWVEEEPLGEPDPCCVLRDLLPMEDSGEHHLGMAIVAVTERATQYEYVAVSPALELHRPTGSPIPEVAAHSTGSICTADLSSIPREVDHRTPDRPPAAKLTQSEPLLRGSAGSVLEHASETWSPSVLSPRSEFPISTLTNALKRLNYSAPLGADVLGNEDKKVLLHRVVQHEHTIEHIEELQRQLERAKEELRSQSAHYWGALSGKQ